MKLTNERIQKLEEKLKEGREKIEDIVVLVRYKEEGESKLIKLKNKNFGIDFIN